VQRRAVVSCFLCRSGRVLLLRRSASVHTYPGAWAAVSGAMESLDAAAEALREVREETGLAPPRVEVEAVAPPLRVPDPALGIAWEVHPVRASVAAGAEPRLDWEHTEARWVLPEEVAALPHVPALPEALEAALRA
jgi:8-oxo-dGTP diphosphatase